MAKPINLNQARKAKARAEAGVQAAQNRVKFGLTKAQKTLAKAQADKAARALDQSRRED